MSLKARSISKGIIEAKDRGDNIQISVNPMNLSPQTNLISGSYTKKANDFRTTAPFIFHPGQINNNGESSSKPHSNLQKYSMISNVVNSGNTSNNNAINSMSVTSSTNNFLSGTQTSKTQYKLFNDNNKALSKAGKSKEINYTNNLSNSSAVRLPDAGPPKIDLLIKKKNNLTNNAIKSVRSVVKNESSGVNLTSNKFKKEPPQTQIVIKDHEQHESKRNDGKPIGISSTVLTSMGSCEIASSSLYKGDTNSHDTRDNTYSNTSTIKFNSKIPKLTQEVSPIKPGKKGIENPEDLHFFYIKTIQANKELLSKFDKED